MHKIYDVGFSGRVICVVYVCPACVELFAGLVVGLLICSLVCVLVCVLACLTVGFAHLFVGLRVVCFVS